MLQVSESGGGGIPLLEPGTYPAVCYSLIDLGEQYSKTFQAWSRKILIGWELPGEVIDTGDGQPSSRVISAFYTLSLGERANLRRDLETWRGRDFTAEELSGFDLRTIVGKPCLLSVVHRDRNGQPRAEVGAVMRLGKGMTVPDPRLDRVVFDLDADDLNKIDALPEWIGKIIRLSPQYERRQSAAAEKKDDNDAPPSDDWADDDLPF